MVSDPLMFYVLSRLLPTYVDALLTADNVKQIGKKDEFDPNQFYVSLTSHAEQFGVEPVRIRVRPCFTFRSKHPSN